MALLLARETHFRHKEGVAYAVRRRGDRRDALVRRVPADDARGRDRPFVSPSGGLRGRRREAAPRGRGDARQRGPFASTARDRPGTRVAEEGE